MPARLTRDTWQNLVRRTPFVGISFSGATADDRAGRAWTGRISFGVMLVTAAATPQTRALGDVSAPGLTAMVAAGIIALNGFNVGGSAVAGAGSASVRQADALFADEWLAENLAVAALSVDVPVSLVEIATAADSWTFDGTTVATTDTIEVPQ